ncbi:uncharacterized protein LOC112327204 isoform X2 [Populus trichocarpa]|nr:uncharacterized protein LOC112327204 isoform X2 [Populus trichocarpa]|eukprot:XP_024454903.1 uncharacterized protein LOC112327204 isoform X2 [Populus trichocarpa]
MYKHVNRHGTYEVQISIAWEGRRGGSFANPLLVTTYVTISLSISQLFFRSPIFISAHDFTGVGIQFPGCCSYSACTIAAHVVLASNLEFFSSFCHCFRLCTMPFTNKQMYSAVYYITNQFR